ncbi:hypothetical protein L3Y34_012883 [Caenorhabditis briggsae]|uniref:Histone-lysine N-methyltransferase, H3 lysine-79 specific n=1 Tax=Caenorhabditis briggsae TaxID=6238 RepID=A0AAE8ZSH8_CAEBR|nr:hypothetical protein L3Y34_012883 [Caenorhabditis briggsae]
MMHLHRNDLLTIESTSASKPSLLSSFWSINVQVQNNERLEDPKTCSQFSLPEVAAGQGENQSFPNQRPTRSASVTELSIKFETAPSSSELPASFMTDTTKDLPLAKETASCRVADWLTNLDINKLMKNFGKRFGRHVILEGDIINIEFSKKIKDATVIFINTLLFDAPFMLRLKMGILQHLDEGVKIITTKPLGDPKQLNVR